MSALLRPLVAVTYLVVIGLGAYWLWSQPDEAGTPRSTEAMILAVNDVYRIAGVDQGSRGGIARLRTLRASLEKTHPDLLFLHAGDVLSPSFLSRTYHGQQMIDVLNMMDGQTRGDSFDKRMFVVFGNHEFDDSSCANPKILRDRVFESEFTWLVTNIDFADCAGQPPMLPSEKTVASNIVEAGGLRIGLFGLTIPVESDTTNLRMQPKINGDFKAVARVTTRKLRAQGADVVVALTHLNIADDLTLLDLGDDAPDLIVGGHDHNRMARPSDNPRVYKADADATTASVFRITRTDGADNQLQFTHEFVTLDDSIKKDAQIQLVVDQWLYQHQRSFCITRWKQESESWEKARNADAKSTVGLPPQADLQCLDRVIGLTKTPLEAEEVKNRGQETGLGDWIADVMQATDRSAQVALLNSGTLRLNYDLPAGAIIQRRQVEELISFPVELVTVDVSGAAVWAIVSHSLAARNSGAWGHISGVAAKLGADERLAELLVRSTNGKVEKVTPGSAARFRMVTTKYIACGGDGYQIPAAGRPASLDCSESMGGSGNNREAEEVPPEVDLKVIVAKKIEAEGYHGIEAVADGRICEPGAASCLFDLWAQQVSEP